jgi:hypothetical protein
MNPAALPPLPLSEPAHRGFGNQNKQKNNMKNKRRTTPERLGSYLTAAVGIGTLAGTADAAVVNLNVSSISAVNGGVVPGNMASVSLSSLGGVGLTGDLFIMNIYDGYFTGIAGSVSFAVNDVNGYAVPHKFSAGQQIDASANWTSGVDPASVFAYTGSPKSPDFGPGSFMGFRSLNGRYGWLEVTWVGAAEEFYILSGAYEDVAGVGILAGAGAVSAIPEPTSVLGTMGLLASGLMIRRRKLAA